MTQNIDLTYLPLIKLFLNQKILKHERILFLIHLRTMFFFDPNVFDLLKSVFDPLLLWLVSGSKCSHISDLVHKYQSGSKCLRVLFWKSIEHYLSREFLLISVTWWNGHMMIITRRRTNLRIQNLTFETHKSFLFVSAILHFYSKSELSLPI